MSPIPSVAAAWATVPPFEPAGVIVLADATSIIERSRDRYVGDEVRRQIVGADLIIVTKADECDEVRLSQVDGWVAATSRGAPSIRVVDGRVPTDVVLGVRSNRSASVPDELAQHADHYLYESWSWTSTEPVARAAVDRFVASLPADVLRVKGRILLDDGSWVLVQVVGRRTDITPCCAGRPLRTGRHRRPPSPHPRPGLPNPFALHFG